MCSEIEYAQSEAMKYPGGNERTQAGMLVLRIATLSLVFPGAARQKNVKRKSASHIASHSPHTCSNVRKSKRQHFHILQRTER